VLWLTVKFSKQHTCVCTLLASHHLIRFSHSLLSFSDFLFFNDEIWLSFYHFRRSCNALFLLSFNFYRMLRLHLFRYDTTNSSSRELFRMLRLARTSLSASHRHEAR